MEDEEVVPQFNDYEEVFDTPDGRKIAISVHIKGDFLFVTAAQARAYLDGESDEQDLQYSDSSTRVSTEGLLIGRNKAEDSTDGRQMGRVVAEHVHEQIVSWHQFTGTWLGIGDEVEHLDPERGVFRIVGRLFGLYPQRIGFTVQYRAIDWTQLPG